MQLSTSFSQRNHKLYPREVECLKRVVIHMRITEVV